MGVESPETVGLDHGQASRRADLGSLRGAVQHSGERVGLPAVEVPGRCGQEGVESVVERARRVGEGRGQIVAALARRDRDVGCAATRMGHRCHVTTPSRNATTMAPTTDTRR